MITKHDAEVVHDRKYPGLEYLAKCSCQTEGRFGTEAQAIDWLTIHLKNYSVDPKTIQTKEEPEDGSVEKGQKGSAGGQQVQGRDPSQGVGGGSEGGQQATGESHRAGAGAGERVKHLWDRPKKKEMSGWI
jgi:hypothetical protein